LIDGAPVNSVRPTIAMSFDPIDGNYQILAILDDGAIALGIEEAFDRLRYPAGKHPTMPTNAGRPLPYRPEPLQNPREAPASALQYKPEGHVSGSTATPFRAEYHASSCRKNRTHTKSVRGGENRAGPSEHVQGHLRT
jgi:hypothetical protein